MSDIAIRVENLGKKYSLGLTHSGTIRDAVQKVLGSRFRVLGSRKNLTSTPPSSPTPNTSHLTPSSPLTPGTSHLAPCSDFWALRDTSFEVRPGEVLGVIGRNGAGKSTLLKILSRVTWPTEGRAEIAGRVSSLLEVGTGFHQELTGRENVFLNGSILGMSRREIKQKFDDIVDFAGIGQFIDTPVKRYSSGMRVRLGFAVAAHLDPDVLIIDEVLAVGDAEFQRRCLGKMEEVAHEGRTVVFVSHNMGAVQALCNRGIVLSDGRITCDAPIEQAVDSYLGQVLTASRNELESRADRGGLGNVRLRQIQVQNGSADTALCTGCEATFRFHLTGIKPGLACTFTIYDMYGRPVTNLSSRNVSQCDAELPDGDPTIICRVAELPLVGGQYFVNVRIDSVQGIEDHVEGAATFQVVGGAYAGRPSKASPRYGAVCLRHQWELPHRHAR